MLTWLDGNVLCEESKRYVNNFLVVTRVRPDDEDPDNVHSDDLISDEELHVDKSCFDEAMSTRMGSGKNSPDALSTFNANENRSTFGSALPTLLDESIVDVFPRACLFWPVPSPASSLSKKGRVSLGEDDLKTIRIAACALQQRNKPA